MSIGENFGRLAHTSPRIVSEFNADRYEHKTNLAWEKYGPAGKLDRYDSVVRKLRARYGVGDAGPMQDEDED
ncbi:MAG: hypothetical protein AAB573_04025 [Patescibacteria group bacterium]